MARQGRASASRTAAPLTAIGGRTPPSHREGLDIGVFVPSGARRRSLLGECTSGEPGTGSSVGAAARTRLHKRAGWPGRGNNRMTYEQRGPGESCCCCSPKAIVSPCSSSASASAGLLAAALQALDRYGYRSHLDAVVGATPSAVIAQLPKGGHLAAFGPGSRFGALVSAQPASALRTDTAARLRAAAVRRALTLTPPTCPLEVSRSIVGVPACCWSSPLSRCLGSSRFSFA
jgi:hypothetical protein